MVYVKQESGQICEEMDVEGNDIVKLHAFDHVFGDNSSNQGIFDETASKLADSALDGFNTVLFMYGQTSSGTVSMLSLLPIPLCLLYVRLDIFQERHLLFLVLEVHPDWCILQWIMYTLELCPIKPWNMLFVCSTPNYTMKN